MTWVKVDDGITEHPKFATLTPQAWTLWLHGLCYCSRNRTDGFIPDAIVPRLANVRTPNRFADELVDAGLWHRSDTNSPGIVIHDYLEHQRSREQIERETLSGNERKRRSRARNARNDGESGDVSRRDISGTDPSRSRSGHGSVTPTETETETETDTHLRVVRQTETVRDADTETPRRKRLLAQVRGQLTRYPEDTRGAIFADALVRIDDTLDRFPDAPDDVVVHYLTTRDGQTLRHYRTEVAP